MTKKRAPRLAGPVLAGNSTALLAVLSSVLFTVLFTVLGPAGPAAAVPVTAGPMTADPMTADPMTTGPMTTDRVETEPSESDLAAQHAEVARLRAEAHRQVAQVDDTQRALRAAAVLAGQALQDYSVAVRRLGVLQASERRHDLVLSRAQAGVDRSRRQLGDWVRATYRSGTGAGLADDATVTALLTAADVADLATTREVLRRIGRDRSRDLDEVAATRRLAEASAARAAQATRAAAVGAVQAATTKQAADAAVDTQRRLLGLAESSLVRATADADESRTREQDLRARRLRLVGTTDRSGTGGTPAGNRVSGQVGDCTGGGMQQYPNGRIPLTALCPLSSAPGQYLRADAAFAFDRMSHAYASRFGGEICVTDSYRSYPAQVSLFARKPALAAVPGTSNHGWGTATDLCGGIQGFGTVQHTWMLLNAPFYGWFHPAWAEPGGSRPEPWHWEYGG